MPSQPQKSEEKKESEFNLDELPQVQLTGHQWVQRGAQIICNSCPFDHASYIPPGYQLYGTDKGGLPIIKKLKF